MFDLLLMGFEIVFQWQNLLAIVIGVAAGIFVGAMPGLSASTGVAILVPFTFGMPAVTSLVLLASLYTAAEYGGSIAAICVNTPGTPAAAATVFDGYQLTKKGQPGKALGVSIIASSTGGFLSTFVLMFFSIPLAKFALSFGAPEYFALGVFGLTIIASLSGKDWAKGFIAAAFGLLLKTMGLDPLSGFPRFTFNNPALLDGIPFIPALIGLFAVSEVFKICEDLAIAKTFKAKVSRQYPTLQELRGLVKTILRSSAIGAVIGTVPGAGATIAGFVSYNEAKRASKDPEKFGTGILEGVAAPEAANNASVGGALIPLLTLGIPGSATTAVLIGALMMQGLMPGPMLFTRNPDLVYGLFAALFIAAIVLCITGLLGIQLWTRLISAPKNVLAVVILAICFLGAYSVQNSMYGVWVAIIFGIIGYIMQRYGFPVAPTVLALVLGSIVEKNFRRSLVVSQGDIAIFFTRPLTVALLILAAVSFIYPFYREWKGRKNNKKEASTGV